MNKSLKRSSAGLIAIAMLTACGGGGGGGGNTQAQTVSQGTITGFGSVIVDGVRYSSVAARILDEDGGTLSRDSLRIGMTVNVEGSSGDDLGTGEARVIEVRRLLQGPLSGLQNAGGITTFSVLGQNVATTPGTLIVGTLANASNVKVYGLLQQGTPDRIIASRIEVAPQTGYEVYGRVSGLSGSSFSIGTLAVTSSAPLPASLANGSLVKASCSTVPGCSNGTTTLAADRVRLRGARSDLNGQAGNLVKLKGVVDAVSGNLLTVSGIPVDISNAQREDKDAQSSRPYVPAAGDRVEVKGRYDGTTLIARNVEQEGYRESRHEGASASYGTELYGIVSANSNACATAGGDYLVQSVCIDNGSLALPSPGQYVEIKGNMNGDVLVVVKLDTRSGSSPTGGYIELKGTVSNFNGAARTFSLGPTNVNYANAAVKGSPGTGSFVEIKGTQDAQGVFQATRVEVESGS